MIRASRRARLSYAGDDAYHRDLDRRFADLEAYPVRQWLALSDQEQLDLLFGRDRRLVPADLLDVGPCVGAGGRAHAIRIARIGPAVRRAHEAGTSIMALARTYELGRDVIRRILRETEGAPSTKRRHRGEVL